jgi:hypothetical protein
MLSQLHVLEASCAVLEATAVRAAPKIAAEQLAQSMNEFESNGARLWHATKA